MGQLTRQKSLTFDRKLIAGIFSLAIPSIVTNVTTPLLGITDVAIAGHMGSAVFIAAIAVGGSMFNMLYWLFGFLRMGSSGMTAQCYGAADHKGTSTVLYRALSVAMSIGIVMIALHSIIGPALLDFMDTDTNTRQLAAEYFDICIWGAPAVLGSFALTGWFLGMQNSKAPMWVSIFMDFFNIGLSLMLVYVFDYGIGGIAIGTMCAQWGGFLFGIALCIRRYGLLRVEVRHLLQWESLKRFFAINTDIFLRTVCLVSVTIWFTRAGAQQGAVMLAVNALLMQLFTLFSFFMDGFAFSGEALCGRFKGERNAPALQSTIKILWLCGFAIAIIFSGIYAIGGEDFLKLLSSDNDVIVKSADYLWLAAAIPLTGFLAFVWDGVFIGTTDTRSMLLSMTSATVIFFAVYFATFTRLGNYGLWTAFLCYLLTRGVSLSVIGRKYFKPDYLSSLPYSAR